MCHHMSNTHVPLLQVVLVSATLPAEVLEMTNKFMTDPIRVLVKRDELTLEVSRGREGAGLGGMCMHALMNTVCGIPRGNCG